MPAEAKAARPTSQPHLSQGVRESICLVFPNFKYQACVSVGRAQSWSQWSAELNSTKVSPSVCILYIKSLQIPGSGTLSQSCNRVSPYNQNARLCHDDR